MNNINIRDLKYQPADEADSPLKQPAVKVDTVEQYLAEIDKVYDKLWGGNQAADTLKYSSKVWFRGLKDKDYQMLPSLGRSPMNVDYETIYLSKFKSKAIPYLGFLPAYPFSEGLQSYWDWLFLMQHYGVPTRLMDWSEDALVALLFAIDVNATPAELAKDPVVWCLNPVKLNEAFVFNDIYPTGYIPNVEEDEVYELFGRTTTASIIKNHALYMVLSTTRGSWRRRAYSRYSRTRSLWLNLISYRTAVNT